MPTPPLPRRLRLERCSAAASAPTVRKKRCGAPYALLHPSGAGAARRATPDSPDTRGCEAAAAVASASAVAAALHLQQQKQQQQQNSCSRTAAAFAAALAAAFAAAYGAAEPHAAAQKVRSVRTIYSVLAIRGTSRPGPGPAGTNADTSTVWWPGLLVGLLIAGLVAALFIWRERRENRRRDRARAALGSDLLVKLSSSSAQTGNRKGPSCASCPRSAVKDPRWLWQQWRAAVVEHELVLQPGEQPDR